ncbi:DUF6993 domain-containing protein [Microbacterium panaciterrae]|uniref:DUF6993 domain-containing protein n=1 Tax=Microbacterium panaciterrae TaxID=985759 RepID=A0ABP8PA48_9MICO
MRTGKRRSHGARLLGSRLLAALALGSAALVLSGCTVGPSQASTGPAAAASASTSAGPGATPETAAPALNPAGSAKDNLPYFTTIVARVWASDARGSDRAYIDALSAGGFARADMQMTADTTTVGNPAESFQFSVRWGATECLVGQVGPSTGDPVTAVLPQLAGGRCLIGDTPPVGG